MNSFFLLLNFFYSVLNFEYGFVGLIEFGFFCEIMKRFLFDFIFVYLDVVMEDVFVKFQDVLDVIFIVIEVLFFVIEVLFELFFSNEFSVEYLDM